MTKYKLVPVNRGGRMMWQALRQTSTGAWNAMFEKDSHWGSTLFFDTKKEGEVAIRELEEYRIRIAHHMAQPEYEFEVE